MKNTAENRTLVVLSLGIALSACGSSDKAGSTSGGRHTELRQQSLQVVCDAPKAVSDPVVYTSATTCGKTGGVAVDTNNSIYEITNVYADGRYALSALLYPYGNTVLSRSSLAFQVYEIDGLASFHAGKKVLNSNNTRFQILELYSDGRVRLDRIAYPYGTEFSSVEYVAVEVPAASGIRTGARVIDSSNRTYQVHEVYSNGTLYAELLSYPYGFSFLTATQVSPEVQ